ncbi:MAG: hypothetical protein LUE93_14790 [Bacteroides sp.]|nr:hypothetical protein [Bacteroides sp.]
MEITRKAGKKSIRIPSSFTFRDHSDRHLTLKKSLYLYLQRGCAGGEKELVSSGRRGSPYKQKSQYPEKKDSV